MGAGSFGQPWAAPALGKSRSTPPARCVASGWRGGDRESTTVCLHRLERQLSWGGGIVDVLSGEPGPLPSSKAVFLAGGGEERDVPGCEGTGRGPSCPRLLWVGKVTLSGSACPPCP